MTKASATQVQAQAAAAAAASTLAVDIMVVGDVLLDEKEKKRQEKTGFRLYKRQKFQN